MKQVLLIGSVGEAPYVEQADAYMHGVMVDDTSDVEVLDMIVTQEKKSAAIYYVIRETREVPEDDAAPEPE